MVDHAVADTGTTASAATTLLANCIQLIEDDDMKTTLVTLFFILLLGIREQFSDVFLRLTHVLVENFWTVDNLGLSRIKHLSDLPSDEGFTRSWRSIEQKALDVLNAKFLNQTRGKNARRKSTTEDRTELGV